MKYILILLLLTACAETPHTPPCVPEELVTYAHETFPNTKIKVNEKGFKITACRRKQSEHRKEKNND